MANFILDYNNIHPKAKEILKDAFYWDLTNPNSPFSLNRVSNPFEEFEEWRSAHRDDDPIDFLPVLDENEFIFNRNKTDIASIEHFFSIQYEHHKRIAQQYLAMTNRPNNAHRRQLSEEDQNKAIEKTAKQKGVTALKEQDDEIISAGFGQFILEGKIDDTLKIATGKAIERQLNPIVINSFPEEDFRQQRKRDFERLLSDLKRIE